MHVIKMYGQMFSFNERLTIFDLVILLLMPTYERVSIL